MNIIGNVISGQVTGDTAKQLSERFGKIIQDRESVSINRSDNSVSKSVQLEVSVPRPVLRHYPVGSLLAWSPITRIIK